MAVFLIKEPRCVFIHIPKTGGASIRHGFFEGNVEGPSHGSVPAEWQDLFSFAFVRHPLDRLVSAWKMFRDGMQQSVWKKPSDVKHNMSMREFMDVVIDTRVPFDGIRDTTEKKIRHHTIPQTHPFNCLDHAQFVGRFENLQTDFATVCELIDIENKPLAHWNRTRQIENVIDVFDSESLAIARDFYADDFREIGYKFEAFHKYTDR